MLLPFMLRRNCGHAAAANHPATFPTPPSSLMDIQEIRSIVELMHEHGLTLLDLSHKDFHLKLKKGPDLDDLRGLLASLPTAAPVAVPPQASARPRRPAA